MTVMNSGGFGAVFFIDHSIKFSNLYSLTWRNLKSSAMVMDTTVELSMALDPI